MIHSVEDVLRSALLFGCPWPVRGLSVSSGIFAMVQRSASRDAFVSKISDCLAEARAALQALEYCVAEDFEQVQRDLLECRVQSVSLQEELDDELDGVQNELPGLRYFWKA